MTGSTATTPRLHPVDTPDRAAGSAALAGTPVAVLGARGRAGAELRHALLDAGAAVATIAAGAPIPPGTRWIVDLAGLPAGTGRDEHEHDEPGLGPDSVLVVTGGGRGIGARAAIALARAFGCGIELVEPEDDRSHLAGCGDTVAVRPAILGRGELGRPGEIAAERDRTLAAREIHRTLMELSEHAAFAAYRSLDARDAAALAAAIDDIRTRHGRLDGLVRVAEVSPAARARSGTHRGAAPGEVA